MTSSNVSVHKPVAALLYTLTFSTGLVNAVTLLGLGGIFSSLMTGNVVFIGLALGGADDPPPLRSALAILAFVLGAMLAGRLLLMLKQRSTRTVLLTMACLETTLMLLAAWLGHAFIDGTPGHRHAPEVVLTCIAATSFAMGIRNASIGKINAPDLKTTVMTLALAGLGSDSGSGQHKGLQAFRRIASVILLALGAAAGAAMFHAGGIALPLLMMAVVVMAATVAFAASDAGKLPLADLNKQLGAR